ncbi:VWA domain-containing protein [Acidaminococcus timonensis]|uniref:VWA domain-containing protein n=1 Tax=Acidaminococcus timonensis TaxID=1871002 RepID=UPI00307A7451
MFTDLFYLLRSYGVKVSLLEWMDFLKALEKGFHQNNLLFFYQLGRIILIKRNEEYDRYDQAFMAYFKQFQEQEDNLGKVREWLRKSWQGTPDRTGADALWNDKSLAEIRQTLEERLKEQKEEHHGGNHWIGTGGATPFGHSGYAPEGIRILGRGSGRSALKIAGERKYRDFREDTVLGIRQFQVALRKLRKLSSKDTGRKTELDVQGTIQATCQQGGNLRIVLKRPRKNQTRLLLLMDWGGSMWAYVDLVRKLFKAFQDNNHFKELKIYYFHNVFYDQLFRNPDCSWEGRIATEQVWNQLPEDTKVVVVGDGEMGPDELWEVDGNRDDLHGNREPGIRWLQKLQKRFPSSIWLNPLHPKLWEYKYSTVTDIGKVIPMFPLTVQGLEQGIQELKK